MTYFKAPFELLSVEEAKAIARADSRGTDFPEKYIQKNTLSYYIAINTWLMLFKEYSTYLYVDIRREIINRGFKPVIGTMSGYADRVVKGEIPDGFCHALYGEIRQYKVTRVMDPVSNIGRDCVTTLLTLLRFPKRFSVEEDTMVIKNTINDFILTENRSKMKMRTEYSRFIISAIKEEISSLIDWNHLIADIKKVDYLEFTSGATFSTDNTLASKLAAVRDTDSNLFYKPFGLYLIDNVKVAQPESWRSAKIPKLRILDPKRVVRVKAVPKSYKAARIIAMEDPVRGAKARAVMSVIDKYCPKCIPLHDQSINQVAAEYGSRSNKMTTIDLSHGSDTVTKVFVQEVVPSEFWDLIYPLVGTHYSIDGKERVMHQFSTAGNALTFFMEALVFVGTTRAASRYQDLFCGTDTVNYCLAYGDDLTCHHDATPIVYEFLSLAGFIVNEGKSFDDGPYRESCGKEYLDGIDVSQLYYPRHLIRGSVGEKIKLACDIRKDAYTGESYDSTASLVSLQHKLFYVCKEASVFLFDILRSVHPNMTISEPGSECGDLWGILPSHPTISAPCSRIVAEKQYDNKGYYSGVTRNLVRCDTDQTRETVYTLTTQFLKPDQDVRLLYDLYKYERFLRFGPRYDSELDKLLGVTAPYPSYGKIGKRQGRWILKSK